jgi:hypothetical protein
MIPEKSFQVGGEVESYCTSCRATRWHIVVAIVDSRPVKVECLSCHKQHAYRPNKNAGESKPTATVGPRVRASKAPQVAQAGDLEVRIRDRERDARAYSPGSRYAVDDIVRHPQFGCGLVIALPATQRMEVAFLVGRKLLVHDRVG